MRDGVRKEVARWPGGAATRRWNEENFDSESKSDKSVPRNLPKLFYNRTHRRLAETVKIMRASRINVHIDQTSLVHAIPQVLKFTSLVTQPILTLVQRSHRVFDNSHEAASWLRLFTRSTFHAVPGTKLIAT